MYKLADPIIDEKQIELIKEVFISKQLVHGDKCELFEQKLSTYLNVDKNSVAVTSSCTASLHLALLALEIKPGEGVLVPNFTFPATVNVIEQIGAIPIFVDVEPDFYCMDTKQLVNMINRWKEKLVIKAIIVVHEFGAAAQMNQINQIAKENNLFIIEDAACAFGTEYDNEKVGLLSDVGCFSFHPRKALTTGEGGAVVSRNQKIVERVKILRNHGMVMTDHGIDFVAAGLNYRLTNFQAAMGVVQLDYFDQWIEVRRKLQSQYRKSISSKFAIHPKFQLGHTWQSYMLVLSNNIDRNLVIKKLKALGVESNFGAYSVLSTVFYSDKYSSEFSDQMSVSGNLFEQGICLPLHQNLSEKDVIIISEIFESVLSECEVSHAI